MTPCFLLYSSNPGIGASMVIALFPLNQHSYSQARHSVPTLLANSSSPPRAGFPSLITKIPRSKSLHPAAHAWVLQPTHLLSSIMTLIVLSSKCMVIPPLRSQSCHSHESGNPGKKKWIPDQVRNDIMCKVISQTINYALTPLFFRYSSIRALIRFARNSVSYTFSLP